MIASSRAQAVDACFNMSAAPRRRISDQRQSGPPLVSALHSESFSFLQPLRRVRYDTIDIDIGPLLLRVLRFCFQSCPHFSLFIPSIVSVRLGGRVEFILMILRRVTENLKKFDWVREYLWSKLHSKFLSYRHDVSSTCCRGRDTFTIKLDF